MIWGVIPIRPIAGRCVGFGGFWGVEGVLVLAGQQNGFDNLFTFPSIGWGGLPMPGFYERFT